MIRIALPWPDRRLSPNARSHWAQKAKAVKQARRRAWAEALAAGSKSARLSGDTLAVTLEIMPPDRRRRDDDNIIASCKAYRDGIADALGIDDHCMRLSRIVWSEPSKPGQIVVVVE